MLAAFATLVALFYTVENWRGRRAWESCRHELEAKGGVLDWAPFIPAPVPEDQNFVKAPGVGPWFVKGEHDTNAQTGLQRMTDGASFSALVAQKSQVAHPIGLVHLWPAGAQDAPSNAVPAAWLLGDRSGVPARLGRLIGVPLFSDPRNFGVIAPAQSSGKLQHVDLILPASAPRTVSGSDQGVGSTSAMDWVKHELEELKLSLEPTGQEGEWRLVSKGITAEGFLEYFSAFEPDLRLLDEAYRRPYARFDGDYDSPYEVPIPNYVHLRTLAQSLAEQASAHMALGQSAEALQDLRRLRGLIDVLGKLNQTLVGAMIRVAVAGLYVNVLGEGLASGRLGDATWPELSGSLGSLNVITNVTVSLAIERAAVIHMLEHFPRWRLAKAFTNGNDPSDSPWRHGMGWFILLAPRGWFYQNQVVDARLLDEGIAVLNPDGTRLTPRVLTDPERVQRVVSSWSPYSLFAGMAVPNFTRAMATGGRNQTIILEARVAIALEQYRVVHGGYPDSLEALAPEVIPSLPRDLFTGGTFIYRKQGRGYLLYSVGWNEKDDGGIKSSDLTSGDWVWDYCPSNSVLTGR